MDWPLTVSDAILTDRMKHSSRYVLALTLVATTLCADRLFASDQLSRVETRPAAERLVARLTRGFGHIVPHTPLVVQRHMTSTLPGPMVVIATHPAFCLALSPLQFRMPPPTL